MLSCLTPAEIEQFVAGRILAAQRDQVREHLDRCAVCRGAVRDEQLFADVQDAVAIDIAGPAGEPDQAAGAEVDIQSMAVADGYRVIEELHRGGQGVVYRAVQLATKRTLALKVLLAGVAASDQQRQRFEREIDIAASLRHRRIVTIYDSGTHQGQPYLAMEYVEGVTLDKYLASQKSDPEDRRVRSGSLKETLQLFQQISGAIGYAHTRGVIHRDLKPGNIILNEAGEPHILDFGLAKLADAAQSAQSPTVMGEFLGTLAYASPEQTKGDPKQIDVRTDVYSLGVILFEMLTGSLPYDVQGTISETLANICDALPPRPSQLRREIDDEVETIVLKALAKDPERRYQSAEHLDRDIRHYLAGEPIDAKRDSGWYLVRKSLKRYRLALGIAASFLAVIGIALVVSLASLRQALSERNHALLAGAAARRAEAAELVQRKEAELQRGAAETQRQEAELQRNEAEFQAYVANIAATSGALRMHDVVEATLRLNAAPTRYRGWEWSQLVHELDGSRKTLHGQANYVTRVTISPEGDLVAASGYDHSVRIWDAKSGQSVAVIEGSARASIAFSPDGGQLAIGWWNGEIQLWDVAQREQTLQLFERPGTGIHSLAFSPDGTRLAACFHSQDNAEGLQSLVVLSLPAGDVLHDIPTPAWQIMDLAFHPDGETLATVKFDGVSLWDLATGSLATRLVDQPGMESCVAYSHNGKWLASGGADSRVHLWDATTGEHITALDGHGGSILSVAFGPDDEHIVSGSRDKTVRIWNIESRRAARVLAGHAWAVSSVAVRADGRRIVTGSWDRTVKVWSGIGSPARDLLAAHSAKVASVAFEPRGRLFATASWDHTIKLWGMRSRRVVATLVGHDAPVHTVAFSPDGSLLASGGWNGTLKLWDVKTRCEVGDLDGHEKESRIHAVAFAPDGQWLVSGSSDNTLRIWDVKTHDLIDVLTGHEDHIHSCVISADGQWIASAGHRTVKVWDAERRVEVASFDRRMMQDDYSLAFHPNNRWLAAGTNVGQMTVWDVVERRSIMAVSGHTDEIHAVTFSPDGTRMVSAAFDDRVKVWSVESGREVATLAGYPGHVNTVAFSPDGYYLVAGLENGMVKIWEGTVAKPK